MNFVPDRRRQNADSTHDITGRGSSAWQNGIGACSVVCFLRLLYMHMWLLPFNRALTDEYPPRCITQKTLHFIW